MVETKKYQQYELLQKKQNVLLNLIERLSSVTSSLDMSSVEKSLKNLQETVSYERLKVLVIGELKRGKSTFVNALLGENVLPVSSIPCTAIISEVKWAESKRALLYPLKNRDENTFNLEPQEINVDEIKDYIVVKDTSEVLNNPYNKVELFWPLELCQNGVEIIDSPGLNDQDTRQKITTNYSSTVDAVLFVLLCKPPVSKSEIDVIDNLLASGYKEMFFICNGFDEIADDQKDTVKDFVINKLKEKTEPWEKRIFFISASDALKGRINKDDTCINNSGIVNVETELQNFLANDKGKIKILRPARQLETAIQAARNIIPVRESMLKTDFKILEKRYEDAQEPLKRLQTERETIVKDLSNFIQKLKSEIADEGCNFYKNMSHKVDDWNKSLNPKTSVNFISLESTEPQIKRLNKEITDYFHEQMNSEFLVWQKRDLEPLISNSLEEFLKDLGNRTEEFLKQVDILRLVIAGKPISLVDEVQTKKVSAIERILAAAGGLIIGGGNLGLAGMGAVFGYQEMAKAIIPQLLFSLTALVFLTTNSWIIFPLMATTGLIQGFFTMKSTNKKIQEDIAKRYTSKIRDTAEDHSKQIAETVVEKLSENLNLIDKGLEQEIKNIREQVNSILQEKKKGQDNVNKKINELQSLQRNLNDIDQELNSLIMEFVLPNTN